MELIKKIKEAESQAKQILEQARAEASKLAEQAQQKRLDALEQAEQQRKKTIEAAVAEAEDDALGQAGGLKADAEQNRRKLRTTAEPKIPAAVEKVISHLKG